MKTSIVVAIAVIGTAVSIGIGFLIGFSVRDNANPNMDHLRVKRAICTFNAHDKINGTIELTEKEDIVVMVGNLSGTEGRHGMHVHALGNIGDCADTKGHYNPDNFDHGAPKDTIRHVGDLGNIDFSQNVSIFKYNDSIIKLNGPRSIIGRSFVIHERQDDMGTGNMFDSKTTGNAGPRIACCVVGLAEEQS